MPQQLKTDWVLFLTIVIMVCFGLVMVYSASSVMAELKFKDANRFLVRQLGWAVVSFVVMMYFKRQDYHFLRGPRVAFAGLGVVLMLLAAVYVMDTRSHRWLNIGSVGIQPSEFAKPALIVFLGYFVTRRAHEINSRYTIGPALLSLGVLAGAVVVPDLGTAMVLVATATAIFYVAGLDRKYMLAWGGICVACLLLSVLLKPYRLNRVISYMDSQHRILDLIDRKGWIKTYAESSTAVRDPGYQVLQSKIAVGSGGVLGLGLMQSRQKLLFLPEAHNDFIYAVVSEELGLWGATGVLVGFLVILWRGLRLYFISPDDYGRYLALGVTVCLGFQALFNMSVVLGIAPTKGIPLPMISYGGSSLLCTMMCLGILLSVSEHQVVMD